MLSCVLRFPREAGDSPWYLEVSGFQLCYRLAAPPSKRPHGQPRCVHSTPPWRRGLAHDPFHGSWCPAGHGNSAENREAMFHPRRTRIKRLVRRTICFSKTERMHDLVIGLFVNRISSGEPSNVRSTTLKHLRILLATHPGQAPETVHIRGVDVRIHYPTHCCCHHAVNDGGSGLSPALASPNRSGFPGASYTAGFWAVGP